MPAVTRGAFLDIKIDIVKEARQKVYHELARAMPRTSDAYEPITETLIELTLFAQRG